MTKDGWDWAGNCPVYFRYSKTAKPLPEPVRGGNLEMLWPYLNIRAEDRPLYAAFLVHYFHPRGPYTIAAMIGGPGQAKSTASRITQQLLDPSEVVGATMSKSDEDLLIGARERRLPVFDKLKAQREWIPANFVPARRPYWSSLYGLKHQFEHGTRYS